MSHAATKWAFDQPEAFRDMKPSEWAVLMVLADCHNPVHGCFPSQDYICSRTNLGERAVRDQLTKLRSRNLVNWDGAWEKGHRAENRYHLAFEADFIPAESAGSQTGKIEQVIPAESDSSYRQNSPPSIDEPVNRTGNRTGTERAGAREITKSEEAQLVEAGGAALDPTSPALFAMREPMRWLTSGMDFTLDVLPAIRATAARAPPRKIRSWEFFTAAIADHHAARTRPMPAGNPRTRNGRRTTTGDLARAIIAAAEGRDDHGADGVVEAPRQLPGT